ncbi:protein O-linked-mannose beta-1,2-N-acetylglucosaminyltransferase 1-like [Pollicipes pollicipes]|uniref:protein O-linked-mannose beta-1,2-N-acetylglucosaminyltransferase 1-like n=1 Tax=Pollicipes pollicipes TaxID=41117 RepID=UPI0018858FF0|nr:protein O-linked-mannose beta-1,2-N-acetylglucosaminyltransferase 1-like [Pollicipes pollicipes]
MQNGDIIFTSVCHIFPSRPRDGCLSSLLPVRGLDLSRLVVFLDGDFLEVRQLLMLLGIRLHRHVVEPIGLASRAVGTRIGFNYRYTIEQAFNMFPDAEKLVLLEEDLEVAPDFLSYFQQTHHLLDKDVSLYCISAWNDHGYQHTVGDPAMLYRIGTLPGLGWMLKRSFFFNEVIPIWPEDWETFDWDVLLRLGSIRRGRDCIIPDVSRTYHFGFVGNHVNSGMQFAFFYDHALNTIPDVKLKDVDRMVFHEYEKLLHELVTTGTKLDGDAHTNSTSCKRIIPSDTKVITL